MGVHPLVVVHPGGASRAVVHPGCILPPVNRMTHAYENITFPHTPHAVGNKTGRETHEIILDV